MTEAQFLKVKFGDILNYTFHDGKTEKVKVVQTYRFAGGGRISAVVLNKQAEVKDCDAPYSCFNVIE